MRIVLIGAGNLATQLGLALAGKNQIIQVFSQTPDNASRLGSKLNCPFTSDLSDIKPGADLYLIAVKDYAIESILKEVNFNNHLVVHTSGSVSINLFESYCSNYGVIYPLQTFTKDKPADFEGIPVFIEANNLENQIILRDLASSVSGKVIPVKSEDRLRFHLSAVFANNFVNHLYYIAEQLLKDQDLDFNILKPLILETAFKAVNSLPEKVQTGPALRNDKGIIGEHLKLLSSYPEWARIYELFSENIYITHKTQK